MRNLPDHVRSKLNTIEHTVKTLTKCVSQSAQAIEDVRERLTGGFQHNSEYADMRGVLDRLLAEQPELEERLDAARRTLGNCQHWLKTLPPDTSLQAVQPHAGNGTDLDAVRERIRKCEEEIEELTAVPTPSADIRQRVQHYVADLARPTVHGIGDGEALQVAWPNSTVAVLALLLPTEMEQALMQAIEHQANSPLPPPQRQQRIAQLRKEIDTLQRQSLALGEDSVGLPPEVVLGVKVVRQPMQRTMRPERQHRIERHQRATSEEVEA